VVTVINTRRRLEGIPSTYTGNSSLTIATPDFPAEAGFFEIASIIEETLKPFRQSPSPGFVHKNTRFQQTFRLHLGNKPR
jgi:hypothetical protein